MPGRRIPNIRVVARLFVSSTGITSRALPVPLCSCSSIGPTYRDARKSGVVCGDRQEEP
jgi:hypothetical protein